MKLKNWIAGACLAALCCISPAWAQSDPLTPLCAPYALYPDTLLAQVLAASTYPDQVMAAAVWCNANPGLTGDALTAAVGSQPWDPSVQALCTFPDVLQKMTSDMDSTRALGQDFLQDKAGVMDCVQSLRTQAQSMGALQTTPQQKIVVEDSTIQIQPADPSTIYVPTYNPTYLYGSSYPYGAGLLTFGAGVALGTAFNNNYGAFNWASHGMYCGAAVRPVGAYGAAGYRYPSTTAWGHTGSTGVYRGPAGNTSVYHTGTTAAGYRGYGASGGAYRSGSSFATTAGGGYAGQYSSRGRASMGRGGFRR